MTDSCYVAFAQAICLLLDSADGAYLADYRLTADDWAELSTIRLTLELFQQASRMMEVNGPTLHLYLDQLVHVLKTLAEYKAKHAERSKDSKAVVALSAAEAKLLKYAVRAFKSKSLLLSARALRRFSSFSAPLPLILGRSTVLNPCLRIRFFDTLPPTLVAALINEGIYNVKELATSTMQSAFDNYSAAEANADIIIQHTPSAPKLTPSTGKPSLKSFYGSKSSKTELERYYNGEDTSDGRTEATLDWWKVCSEPPSHFRTLLTSCSRQTRRDVYPTLARMVKDLFGGQGSSASVERLFSTAAQVSPSTRSSLSPEGLQVAALGKALLHILNVYKSR